VRNRLIFCAGIVILDQFTKFFADKFIMRGSRTSIISFLNFFNIVNCRNTGIEFGMFQGKNFIFSVVVFLLLSGLLLWLYKNWNKINKIQQYAFCLIFSGGLGNFIDRLFRGAVVDFLDFGINSKRWPSFNIADSCICIAICLIFTNLLISRKRKV
jgi:signal peptidase II